MNGLPAEKESLKDEMRNVVEEARMVLPGIQALFGFQTVSVFNNRYESLPSFGMWSHLAALGLLALSIALVMTPAAYHRLAERGQVSQRMIDQSSCLITLGMVPLMFAFALDIFVVVLTATHEVCWGVAGGLFALCLFALLWFAYPFGMRHRR